MENDVFTQGIDRTRLDRLQGEILAFVSDFEGMGYTNLEIARELVAAAFKRCNRETNTLINESFHQHVRDVCIRYLAGMNAIDETLAEKFFVQGN